MPDLDEERVLGVDLPGRDEDPDRALDTRRRADRVDVLLRRASCRARRRRPAATRVKSALPVCRMTTAVWRSEYVSTPSASTAVTPIATAIAVTTARRRPAQHVVQRSGRGRSCGSYPVPLTDGDRRSPCRRSAHSQHRVLRRALALPGQGPAGSNVPRRHRPASPTRHRQEGRTVEDSERSSVAWTPTG